MNGDVHMNGVGKHEEMNDVVTNGALMNGQDEISDIDDLDASTELCSHRNNYFQSNN